MKTSKILLFLFACSVFSYSCQKEKSENPAQQTCKVIKVNYFDLNGAASDSAVYIYTGDKVTKVQIGTENFTLEYNGNNVIKRNYFISGSTTSEAYDQVTYNSDGTISKIENFERVSSNYVLAYRLDLTYTGGKLSKATYSEITNNVATKEEEYVYSYTGNNITSAVYTDFTSSSPSQTFTYTYDTNNNYLKKQNSQILLVDLLFLDLDGSSLPLIFSGNNVLSLSANGQSAPLSYTLDSRQNLGDIRLLTQLFARYTYQCQ